MKKKIIFLIFLGTLISGCDATYNLDLKNSEFRENLEINNYNKSSWDNGTPTYREIINQALNGVIATNYEEDYPEATEKSEGVNYYNIHKILTDNNLGLSLIADFNLDEYNYSNIIFSNTETFKYTYNREKIIIESGKDLNTFTQYPDLNSLTVKFTTNHKVLKNNADEIKNNTYFWYLERDPNNKKTIELELSRDYEKKSLKTFELDKDGYFGSNTLVMVYITLLIILSTGIIYIYLKVKKSNK